MKKIFTLLSLLFIGASQIFATNYYVSALTGNNSFSGTSTSQAFATIKKAADLTNPGDTVFIMNGTYNPISNFQQSIVTITRSGTPGAYITYKAFPGHTPKLQLQTGLNFQIWRAVAIDASYIIFTGIEIQGTNQQLDYAGAYQTWQDYENNIKDWNKISMYNCGSISIGGGAAAHHVVVSNCKIYDTGGGIGGFNCDYITIENNLIYNTCWYSMYAGSGISILDPTSVDMVTSYKIFIRNNIVHNNKTLIPWERTDALSDGNGIILDVNIGNGTTTFPYVGRYLVENNISYNNGGGGIHAFKVRGVDIINNTAFNNGTVVGYPEIDAQSSFDVKIYNNIMYARSGGACNLNDPSGVYDYNIYFNGPSYRQGLNDKVGVDPKFVQQALDATANFQLKNISPAINAGSNVAGQFSVSDILGVARPFGSRPDIGAYEFTGVQVIPPTFTVGNLSILRVGDGTTTLNSNAAAASIVEFTPAGAATPMNVTLGNATSTAPNRLFLSGDNTTLEGQLNLSGDGRFLFVPGYESAIGATAATYRANEKVIGRIVYDGSVDYTTKITAASMNGTVRSTVTTNGARIYITGTSTSPASGNSTRFQNFGTTGSGTAFNGSVRSMAIFNGQVYYANNNIVGSLTPDPAAGNYGTIVTFPGVNIAGHSFQALALLDLNPAVGYLTTGYDVLYCADANLGLVKFSWTGSTWVLSGTFNPPSTNGTTGGLYAITAQVNASGNAQLFAVKGVAANNEVLTLTDATGHTGNINTTNPTVASLTTAGANYMYRGIAFSPAQNAILPIDLLSFKAYILGKNAVVDWTSSTELNAKEYQVEKSEDGRNFVKIATVVASNNANGSNYTFTDYKTLNGQQYYRLKLIDKDGSFKYSKIVTLRFNNSNGTQVQLFPNPVSTYCTVSYPLADANASLRILQIDGKVVAEYNLVQGSSQQSIDVSTLRSGHYLMIYKSKNLTSTSSFIK